MSVTIHHGTSFVVADETGDIAPSSECGFFHLDTRFLSRHELRVDGRCPILLQARVTRANEAWHHLTNPALEGAPRSTLGIAVQRVVGGGLRESIEVENFSGHEARLELGLSFGCDFAYILTVKKEAGGGDGGWHPNIHASVRGDREVRFELDREGAPHRSTLTFDHPPAGLSQDAARFLLRLAPRQRWTATLDLAPSVGEERARVRPPSAERADALRHRRHALGRSMPRVEADHAVLERAADQASHDLAALCIKADESEDENGGGQNYAIAAGIPWRCKATPTTPAGESPTWRDGSDAPRRPIDWRTRRPRSGARSPTSTGSPSARSSRRPSTEKRAVDALTSNPGHLLWTGAVDREQARAVARTLLGDELFSGFGIRTMGEREGGYNPVSYHNGSVWPHDNALILAGLVRYGLHDEASQLADGLLAALALLPDAAPPELFCGYGADRFGTPIRYPTACRPQAWASAAVPLLVRSLLGLEVDALERRVPLAPIGISGMRRLDVLHIPVGSERIDVSVRVEDGQATAQIRALPKGWRRVEPEVEKDRAP